MKSCLAIAVVALGMGMPPAGAMAEVAEASVRLVKIDEGRSWTSPLWGTNAYKLVHDGSHFFTIGHWGAERSVTVGRIYRLDGDKWTLGYEWDDLNYQPGMLLLDSDKRLVLVYPRMREKPVIKRAIAPGNFTDFESIQTPDWMSPAGYLGAGIHDDAIVFGYIGHPEVYSFNVAILDMKTNQWSGPFMLARSQREVEPYTTWRYPIIHPGPDGFEMVLSNGRDSTSYKHQVLHLRLPYAIQAPVEPTVVAEAIPWTRRMAQAAGMLRAVDGTTFITGQFQDGDNGTLSVWRKRPADPAWQRQTLSSSQVGAPFQDPEHPDILWIISSFGTTLRLYKSTDGGDSWEPQNLPALNGHSFDRTSTIHTVSAASGSVIPSRPCAIFTSGAVPDYETWFVQFDAAPQQIAIPPEPTMARGPHRD